MRGPASNPAARAAAMPGMLAPLQEVDRHARMAGIGERKSEKTVGEFDREAAERPEMEPIGGRRHLPPDGPVGEADAFNE